MNYHRDHCGYIRMMISYSVTRPKALQAVPATRRGLCEVPEESDKILEDDIITIWGECDGLYSYESVLGSKVSLPKIDVKYYLIDN